MKTNEISKKALPSSAPRWCMFLHGLVVDLACTFILVFLLMFLIVGGSAIAGAFIGAGHEFGASVLHYFGGLITPASASILAAITIVRYCYRWRKNTTSNATGPSEEAK